MFIYSFLAWYFSQVWPSKVGVAKPFYFLVMPSYWFPNRAHNTTICQPCHSAIKVGDNSVGDFSLPMEELEGGTAKRSVPTEKVNEKLLGAPSVVVHKMRKTFGAQVTGQFS